MSTIDLTVAGEGSQTDGSYNGGAGNYTNLNSDDDDTTRLDTSGLAGTYYHSWQLQDYTYGNLISQIRITYTVAQQVGSGSTATPYVRIGSTNYYGTQQTLYSGDYIEHTQDWTTNPATGVAWTKTGLNNAEFGLRFAMGTVYGKTSYLKGTVTYTFISPFPTFFKS